LGECPSLDFSSDYKNVKEQNEAEDLDEEKKAVLKIVKIEL
jgi:hypothetical protein